MSAANTPASPVIGDQRCVSAIAGRSYNAWKGEHEKSGRLDSISANTHRD
jgi:hypothetical protein